MLVINCELTGSQTQIRQNDNHRIIVWDMRVNRLLGERWCGNRCEKVIPDGNRCPNCNQVVREAPLDSVLRAKVGGYFGLYSQVKSKK